MIILLNRIKGALFGLAIGDALGGTTEFLTKDEIQKKYGKVEQMIGGGVWNLQPGETTDDTAMTIAVARGIIENPNNPIQAVGDYFIKWYGTNPKDIGNIISTVFSLYKGDWFRAAKTAHSKYLDGMSAGNGTLMRCLPIALAYQDLKQVEEITGQQSKMTHYDSLADEACIIYNRIAFHVRNGKNLKEVITDEINGTRYEKALNGKQPDIPPNGFVVHTMEWVLYWLLNEDTFSNVVIGAANEGDDSDTVAAIAGGLAGLSCGYKELPEKYCRTILLKKELEEIAIELVQLAKNH